MRPLARIAGLVAGLAAIGAAAPVSAAPFASPPESAIPNDEFGNTIRLGEAIFRDPAAHAGRYVGNALTCGNCHLDAGVSPIPPRSARPMSNIPPIAPRTGM